MKLTHSRRKEATDFPWIKSVNPILNEDGQFWIRENASSDLDLALVLERGR